MTISEEQNAKLKALVHSSDVVLFMKGSRHFPQCGFSATVVGILDKLGRKYETVNVLSDPAIRDGIKEFSSWPTIPQLYVRGEFVGGCDIVKEMFASGELQKLVGVTGSAGGEQAPLKAPSITVSESAAKAFRDAAGEAGEDVLRLEIDTQFQNDLFFAPKNPGDVEVKASGISIFVDASSAVRADGVTIDFVSAAGGAGFKITNPNEPPRVKPLSATQLKEMHDKGEKLELFDVRTDAERAIAKIEWAQALDHAGQERLLALPKGTTIVMHCHHGVRSRQAAEQLLREGFTNVFNLEGGIDAWSAADPSVKRY